MGGYAASVGRQLQLNLNVRKPRPFVLTKEEASLIRANLFEGAQYVLAELPGKVWHRDKTKSVTAHRSHSSQALALDVFGTIARLDSRDAIVNAWARALNVPNFGTVTIEPEALIPRATLGEPKSTQIDIAINGTEASALIECKFTEADGGSCSQVLKRKLRNASPAAQCNGSYSRQLNPLTGRTPSCALSAKGIRYWDHVPSVLSIRSDIDHHPCPFAGGTYQWMRNLVSAHALSTETQLPYTFIIVYADGPFAVPLKLKSNAWKDFVLSVTGIVPLRTISYQELLEQAKSEVSGRDLAAIERLAVWVDRKIAVAAS